MALRLPSIIGSHMVLQSSAPIRIWGWADPDRSVLVRLGELSQQCSADPINGAWSCEFDPPAPNLTLTLSVQAGDEELTCEDVITGEVWLCSGQSNMAHQVRYTPQLQDAREDADYPKIRVFTVKSAAATSRLEDCEGQWIICSPETVGDFSGVAFYFGRQIHTALSVPMGLVVAAVGNTSIKQWVSRELLSGFPEFSPLIELSYSPGLTPYSDPGISHTARNWHTETFDDSRWNVIPLPTTWASVGLDINGAIWCRRRFDVPEEMTRQECVLSLGVLNDFDVTFINGRQIGATDANTPMWWEEPRYYSIPAGLLRTHDNVIAFRNFNQWSDGWMLERGEHRMRIRGNTDSSIEVPLHGSWRYCVELNLPLRNPATAQPCGNYHAMIAPLNNVHFRGIIWYQGESDVDAARDYRILFPAFIQELRDFFDSPDLPFLFVQLPKFSWPAGHPAGGCLPPFRRIQQEALCLAHTAMAVSLDLGEADDIHPGNKRDVGIRLSLLALNRVYGHTCVDEGPRFEAMEIRGAEAVVRMRHCQGLHSRGALDGFEIAGADGRFFAAGARIEEGMVVVWSESVPAPRIVRYAWKDCPPHPLYNAAGLTAMPFSSDDPGP